MKDVTKKAEREKVTRRGFLKLMVPGLVATGITAGAGLASGSRDGAYGNGPYGGVVKDKTEK